VYEDIDYMAIPWGFTSELIELDEKAKGYLILCLNFEKGYEG